MKLKSLPLVLVACAATVVLFLSFSDSREEYVVEFKIETTTESTESEIPIPLTMLPEPVQMLSKLSENAAAELLRNALQPAVPETLNPRKLQVAILTTWRSGSTFLESVFNAHEGMYNIYEPLFPFGIKTIGETDPEFSQATNLVSDLFNCRYTSPTYMKKALEIKDLLSRNPRVWSVCSSDRSVDCYSSEFLQNSCVLFPYTVMKLVRAELPVLKEALRDPDLNLHVVMLVRDPRAVMNSRISSVDWCKQGDCSNSSSLCSSLEKSLDTFKKWKDMFTGRLHFIRYEDICLNPEREITKLFKSLDLTFDKGTKEFIDTHTHGNDKQPWSVNKNSKEKIMEWTKKLSHRNLLEVQSTCSKVMSYFGYKPVENSRKSSLEDVLTFTGLQ